MTDPATPPATPPVAPAPAADPAAPPTAVAPAPSAKSDQPPWGDDANFDAEKAWKLIQNLRNEKGGGESAQLRTELDALRTGLATALGVAPEAATGPDALAEQVQALQTQILDAEKRALAVEFSVPTEMLTAADASSLRTQATQLQAFAQAAHYAAVTAAPAPPAQPAPAFQPNPGQGLGNTPQSSAAQEEAEYAKFYPKP